MAQVLLGELISPRANWQSLRGSSRLEICRYCHTLKNCIALIMQTPKGSCGASRRNYLLGFDKDFLQVAEFSCILIGTNT